MHVLRISTLGTPAASAGECPLHIPRTQTQAIFYRLAADPLPVSRSHLAFLLWPDVSEAVAQRRLSQRLTLLRKALPSPDLIQTTKTHIGLDRNRVWCDVVEFQSLCQAQEPRDRQSNRQEAIGLYNGQFLAGFQLPKAAEFESWVEGQRRTIQRLYLAALHELVATYIDHGHLSDAIAMAQRYLTVDVVAEPMHRHLIELYTRSGDRAAAQRQYETCVVVLERELGVDPMPETMAAYQAALAAPGPVGDPERPSETARSRPVRRHWPVQAAPHLPFIGREDAQSQLMRAYEKAASGDAQFVLITGEPGIGKTRLLQEFDRSLQYEEALVLVGNCHEGTQAVPFMPLTQALRGRLEEASEKLMGGSLHQPSALFPNGMSSRWLTELTRLLPELHEWDPDLTPTPDIDGPVSLATLHEALYRFLVGLVAAPDVIVLLLDNLHNADQATLAWLTYLSIQPTAGRLLIVGTTRINHHSKLDGLRASLAELNSLTDVQLTGWPTSEVRDELAQVLEKGSAHGLSHAENLGLADHLVHITSGNPFFVLAFLQELMETGQWIDAGNVSLPVPQQVQTSIAQRLRRLDSASRQILEAATVLDGRFGFELLSQTSGRTSMETADALDELCRRDILEAVGPNFTFHHRILRDVSYQELSLWRRRLLHQRAAAALEQGYAGKLGQISSVLAHHYDQAGQPERAVDFWLMAAGQAQRLYALSDALSHLEHGLECLEGMPGDQTWISKRRDMLLLRGQTLLARDGFDNPDAEATLTEAWRLDQQMDGPIELDSMSELAGFYLVRGRLVEALELANVERDIARRQTTSVQSAYLRLGQINFHLGYLEPALTYIQESLQPYYVDDLNGPEGPGFEEPSISGLGYLSWIQWLQGAPDSALHTHDLMLDLAQRTENLHSLVFSHCWSARMHHFRRDYVSMLEQATQAVNMAQEHQIPIFLAYGLVLEGAALALTEEPDQGIPKLEHGIDLHRNRVGAKIGLPYFWWLLAEAQAEAGMLPQTMDTLDQALAEANTNEERTYVAELHRLQGEYQLALNEDAESAADHFVVALQTAQEQGATAFALRAATSQLRLFDTHGTPHQRSEARAQLAALYAGFSQGFGTRDLIEAQRLLAVK